MGNRKRQAHHHQVNHRYKKHTVSFFILIIIGVMLVGGYVVFQRILPRQKAPSLPPLHLQGRIERSTPQGIVVLAEHPSPQDSLVVVQKRYRITINPQQKVSLKTLSLKESGLVVEKVQISAKDIPPDGTIDCMIRLAPSSTTDGSLLSGEVTRVR